MNEKWFSLSIADIEKKLKTNAASGLSPKAARSRLKKTDTSFYIKPRKSAPTMLKEIASDLLLVILILVTVLAVIFGEYVRGFTMAALVTFNIVISFALYFRAQRLFESLSAFFRPSVTVVRSGKAFSVDPERVVPGDVVIILEGDVLCFDARLVTSDGLKVMARVDREREVECEKLAEGVVRAGEHNICNMVNMVHAGSRIVSGGARAIVTEVGKHTYYGAMTGGVRLPEKNSIPHGLKLLKKYCSGFGTILTLVLIPFSLISLIFSSGGVTLVTTFSSVLAIASCSMSQTACTVCRIFFEKQARDSLTDVNPSVMRSVALMDTLASTEYVFLLDGGAVSDGSLHCKRAVSAEGEIRSFNVKSVAVDRFGELVALYTLAESRTLTTGVHAPGRFRSALEEFIKAAKVDTEALKIRCNVCGYVPGNSTDKTDKLFYADMGVRYVLNVAQSRGAVELCGRAYLGEGTVGLGEAGKSSLLNSYDNIVEAGMKALVFTVSENEFSNDNIFVGILALGEDKDPSFEAAVAGMRALGVNTVSFVNAENEKHEQAGLLAPDMGAVASVDDFDRIGQPITYKFGSIRTYKGLSAEHISELIRHVHSKGKKVAVVSFSDQVSALLEKPDVFVSCSALQYRFSGYLEEEIESVEVSGYEGSSYCRQDVKLEADMMIPRPRKSVGGFMSLKSAFERVGAVYGNLVGYFKYVLCSQFIRIFTVMIPMMLGKAFLDARHVLFCGVVMDLFVMMIFATEKYTAGNSKAFLKLSGAFDKPIRNNAGMIFSSALGGIFAVTFPNIIGVIGSVGQYFYQTEYLFISMILMHITLMYCIRIDNYRKYGFGSKNRYALMLDVFAFAFLVICFAFDPVGALFDIRTISLPYLAFTLVPPAICAILYFFIGDIRIHTENRK